MSGFDDVPTTLVSAKLQGVALRTPPPSDTYVIECIIHLSDAELEAQQRAADVPTSSSSQTIRRILRLAQQATAMDLLNQLGLISSACLLRREVDSDTQNALSINSGGIRTQLFAIHPASGDGTPFHSIREANLLSKAPIRESLSLRFPFTIAIIPALPFDRTSAWGPEQWHRALIAQHEKQLHLENEAHASREASMRKPTTGADVIKASAVGSIRSMASRRNLPALEQNAVVINRGADDETNIVVTPAAASNNLSLPTSPLEGGKKSCFLSGTTPGLFVPEERPSTSPGNTPRTPLGATRRRTSSVSLSGVDEDESPAPIRKSPITTMQTRQEKRIAAQAERQRLEELQRVREQNIAKKERDAQEREERARKHVVRREDERSIHSQQEHKVIAERQARIESRTRCSLESKQSLEERHTARILAKKLELQQLMENALGANGVIPANKSDDPFGRFGNEQQHDEAASTGETPGDNDETRATHRTKHARMDRARSVVDLPDAVESELAKLEREQAKTNFVNRVAASRKATERRMSKFSTVKFHPFAAHAELRSLLGQLDADAHDYAKETEERQRLESEKEREHATSEYHRRVMDDSIKKRVELKMERKVHSIEHHIQQIAFEKVKKQDEEQARKMRDADAKSRIAQFYEKRRQEEIAAKDLARREKEMETYIEHQKAALQSLLMTD
jgi:hypothetical protein